MTPFDYVLTRIKCGEGMRQACMAEEVDVQEFAVTVLCDPYWRTEWIKALRFARELTLQRSSKL